MRLHELHITAFGPFAESVTIDFDALSASGLFLLSGATGSGKSSILDAVCFALYGDVPGDRSTAKRLRSDLADPATAPRVRLECTLSSRRFRFERSPAWRRAKRRGTGETTEPAKGALLEQVDGEWITRSTRLDEIGHLVGDLIGMTMAQFCQVAMLPQGEFHTFLRAKPDDRQHLLERLFRTQRFGQVEAWLRHHRTTLRRQSELEEERVRELVSRISEAATSPIPSDWDGHDLATVAGAAACSQWAAKVIDTVTADHAECTAFARAAATRRVEASSRRVDAEALAELQGRQLAAAARAETLAAQSQAHLARLERLNAAHAASALRSLLSLVEETACSHDEAEVILAEARASAAVDTTDRHELAGLEVKAVEAVETARLAVEDAKARLTAEQAIGTYDRDLAALDAEASRQAAMADSVPEKLRAAQESLHESRAAADRLEATSARVRAWQQRADAAERAERLRVELVCAHEARQDAVDRAQAALDVVHDVRERRLSGMAAEIAGGLAVGCSCPVCGSADHPRPAEPEPGAPAAEDERAARKAADDANAARHLHEEHCRDLTTTLALAKTQADGDRATIAEQLAQARAELDLTQHTADRLAADQRAYDALLTQSGALDEARRTLELKRVGMESARATMLANRDSLDARIRQAVPDVADGDPSPLFAERTEGLAHLRQVIAAMDVARTRRTERRRAHRALMAALAETPFACADEARGALCTPEVISRWQEQVTAHDRDVAQVEALLADPELVAASTRPAPDLDVLRAEAQAAEQAGVAADTSLARSRERLGRLSGLRAALDQALSRWAPLLDDVALATSLSQFVDGKSADNLLQMRLSAYVLAYRLTQVVEAANARLLTMSDSRYSLEHSDQRGAGETRGGLSLLVRDDWTGESRDPGTLSGGETFVVSLALALGLADTLTQQSDASAIGDSRLDTLFVDEGFGSLDADTLEDVMNTLDGLREGGRVVGVVSHVAEMHDRIPTRLEVVKGRRGGSTVRASIPVVDATS